MAAEELWMTDGVAVLPVGGFGSCGRTACRASDGRLSS